MGRKYVKIEDDVPFDITIENAAFGIGGHRKIVKTAKWNFECCDCHLVHNVSLVPSKHKIKEVLLAGRGVELSVVKKRLIHGLKDIAPVRIMNSYSHHAKRAAQGACFIANGLLEGNYKHIINNLRIKEASGSLLDDIYIPFDKNKLLSDLN